jgi:hypothetical protein
MTRTSFRSHIKERAVAELKAMHDIDKIVSMEIGMTFLSHMAFSYFTII